MCDEMILLMCIINVSYYVLLMCNGMCIVLTNNVVKMILLLILMCVACV